MLFSWTVELIWALVVLYLVSFILSLGKETDTAGKFDLCSDKIPSQKFWILKAPFWRLYLVKFQDARKRNRVYCDSSSLTTHGESAFLPLEIFNEILLSV